MSLASRRGLTVIHHHFNLLGLDTFRWPTALGTAGWNWESNTATMAYAWKGCIAAQHDLDVMWSVGLRGLNDYAYPCNGDVECGRQISEAMGNQTEWITAAQGANVTLVTYLWQEGFNYLEAGTLKIPPNVNTIFTDSGGGRINFDPVLAGKVRTAAASLDTAVVVNNRHRYRAFAHCSTRWGFTTTPPSTVAAAAPETDSQS